MSQLEPQGDDRTQSPHHVAEVVPDREDAASTGRDRQQRKRRWRLRDILGWGLFTLVYLCLFLALCFLGATMWPYHFSGTAPGTIVIYSQDNQVLGNAFHVYRAPVPMNQIPIHTITAVLAAEDTHFFRHKGLDWHGILRANWANLHSFRHVQDSSTITEQLVRLAAVNERSVFLRRLQEYVFAVRVERAYTKSEILERYLNNAYFGDGIYGISAAAQSFFGKKANQLTPAESAMLAGFICVTGDDKPREDLAAAVQRQHRILLTMVRQQWLAPEQYSAALREKVTILPKPADNQKHPFIVAEVRRQLTALYGRDALYHGGVTVYTSIDSKLQASAEQLLANAVQAGSDKHVGNGALVAIDPSNGYIRALVGGVGKRPNPIDHALLVRRQPGTAFKAFVYQAAIDRGHLLSDTAIDAPVPIGNSTPENVADTYQGQVTLQTALARSLNSVAVRLTREMSPFAVVSAAGQAGITSQLTPAMSIALGTSAVTPCEMARAFATYANGGNSVEPNLIAEIRAGKRSIFQQHPRAYQTVAPVTAFLITQGLCQVIANGTGRQANLGRVAAGETGTSSENRDAWFVGYTPFLSTAVWFGNDDNSPMLGVRGEGLPAQTWARFMHEAHLNQPKTDFPMPDGVKVVRLCTESHLLALPVCPHTVAEFRPVNRIPGRFCDKHYWVSRRVCAESGKLATPGCPHVIERVFPYDKVPTAYCQMSHVTVVTPPPAPVPPTPKPVVTPEKVPVVSPEAEDTHSTPPSVYPHRKPVTAEEQTPNEPEHRRVKQAPKNTSEAPEKAAPNEPKTRKVRSHPLHPRHQPQSAATHPRHRGHTTATRPTHPEPSHPTPRTVHPQPPSTVPNPAAKTLPEEKGNYLPSTTQ